MIARGFLYLMTAVFFAVGLTALSAPDVIAHKFALLPQSVKGTAEIRGLYGGGIVGWGVVTLGALRRKSYSGGLLLAMALIMGGIAAGRIVAILIDHELALSLPAGVAEGLTAWACWTVYRAEAGVQKY
jgi:hypothetical protein